MGVPERVHDRWEFGNVQNGTVVHAVMSSAIVPGSDYFTAWTRCGNGRGSVIRSRGEPFDPALIGALFPTYVRVCSECVAAWEADHADPDGPVKECAGCGKDRPVLMFAADQRTRDGRSRTCRDCAKGRREVVAAANKVLTEETRRVRAATRSHARTDAVLVKMTMWQEHPNLPTFTCPTGHVLGGRAHHPHGAEGASEPRWECPCGSSPVTPPQRAALDAGRDLIAALRHVASTVPVSGEDGG